MSHPDKIKLKHVKGPHFNSVRATNAVYTVRTLSDPAQSMVTITFYNEVANVIAETMVKSNEAEGEADYTAAFEPDDVELIREEVTRVTLDAKNAFALVTGLLKQMEDSGLITKKNLESTEKNE